MSEGEERCLIVGPSWVGDMIMAQSLFALLKRRRPGLSIDVLAPKWTLPLLERMPQVEGYIPLALGHGQLGLKARFELGKGLRKKSYAQAIVLPNSFKSALIPWWARIPRRTGYRGEQRYGLLNDMRRLDPSRLPTTVQRFAALALPAHHDIDLLDCPRPSLASDPDLGRRTVHRLGLDVSRPVLALCPGAEYGSAKRWPANYFAAVARHFQQRGWQSWVFGSSRDSAAAEAVCAEAGAECVNLAGRTSLGEAIDLMAQAGAVVSNDSGLMHMAAALDRPLVAVYGSSDPEFTPPLSSRAKVERLGLPCSPCFERECPLGHLKCLQELSPERVIHSLERLVKAE